MTWELISIELVFSSIAELHPESIRPRPLFRIRVLSVKRKGATIPPLTCVGMDFEDKGNDWRTSLYMRTVSNRYPCSIENSY